MSQLLNTIILNRATKSLTLYYQMIGRGSRVFKNKSNFTVIDLGNNFYRFGPWGADLIGSEFLDHQIIIWIIY